MVKNWAEGASRHRQLTKIGLSDGCGGETIVSFVRTAANETRYSEMTHPFACRSAAGRFFCNRRT